MNGWLCCITFSVCKHGFSRTRPYATQNKGMTVAVVGGGLFGICCSILLAEKGFLVKLYEKTERLGGTLWDTPELSSEVIQAECGRADSTANLEVLLQSNVSSLDELSNFDVVILATGEKGDLFGLDAAQLQDGIRVNGHPVLGGGGLLQDDSDVLFLITCARVVVANAGFALEDAVHRTQISHRPTKLLTDLSKVKDEAPVTMSEGDVYTREEAVEEAKRCLQCECKTCVGGCALLQKNKTTPDRVIKEAYQDLNTLDKIEACMMKRQIFSCTLCGRCTTVCPESVETAQALMTARRIMHKNGKVPPAFHDFWVRDMEFSNDEAGLFIPVKQGKTCTHLFFPGCQISATMPEAVKKAYEYLNEKLDNGVSMRLGCCGAPAYWSGQQEKFLNELDILRQDWLSAGCPTIVTSCPSCHKLLREFLPEAKYISFWEIVSQYGLPKETVQQNAEFAVFDPCAARNAEEVCDSVRDVLTQAGCSIIELEDNRETAKCCGHGGLIKRADPELASAFAKSCTEENEADYVTYCVNCRDVFLMEGKQTKHIFEVLFNLPTPSVEEVADLSKRRDNRRVLRDELLGTARDMEGMTQMKLLISPEVREKMHNNYVLEEDLETVIRHLEETGNKFWNEDGGYITGSCVVGAVTVWIAYRETEEGYEVLNVYSHRMSIQEELK